MRDVLHAPIFVLAGTILLIHLSGNDKATLLLPLPLAVSLGACVLLFAKPSSRRLKPMLIVLFPWLYVISALALSRMGVISTYLTLGLS